MDIDRECKAARERLHRSIGQKARRALEAIMRISRRGGRDGAGSWQEGAFSQAAGASAGDGLCGKQA